MNYLEETLVGREVSGVLFIRSYIEIQCDGINIQFFSEPILVQDGIRYGFKNKGSCQYFIELIGKKITHVTLFNTVYVFSFHDDVKVEVQEATDTFNVVNLIKGASVPLAEY